MIDSLLVFFAAYFAFSATMVFAIDSLRQKAGITMSFSEKAFTLLTGPIIFLVGLILDMLYPASGNCIDIIYSKLNHYEGKTVSHIFSEISAAGESLGWGGVEKVPEILQVMVAMGYARCEKLPIVRQLHEGISSEIEKMSASDEIREELKHLNEAFRALEKEMGDMLSVPCYFKGTPPSRRKRLKGRFALMGWKPQFAK